MGYLGRDNINIYPSAVCLTHLLLKIEEVYRIPGDIWISGYRVDCARRILENIESRYTKLEEEL